MNTQLTADLPKLYIGIDIHKRSWKIHCSTDLFSGNPSVCHQNHKIVISYFLKFYQRIP